MGAGFGGIEAAKSLRRAPVEVTVVDRQSHHCFQPLLYQVGALSGWSRWDGSTLQHGGGCGIFFCIQRARHFRRIADSDAFRPGIPI